MAQLINAGQDSGEILRRICELENGEKYKYDAMSSNMDAKPDYYNPDIFHYLGRGEIYSIGGLICESSNRKGHFWVRI